MRAACLAFVFVALAVPVSAQPGFAPPPVGKTVSLSGPRFGFTSLADGVVETLHEREIDVRSPIAQFGWQFERQFYSKGSGLAAVNEWVLMIGGLDQGVAIPTATWMVGLRTRDGTEFGVGPNITPAGVALAFAAGITLRAGILNVPLNVAVVPSKAGARVSFLTGFNMRR